MPEFTNTNLWTSTLGKEATTSAPSNLEARELLRTTFLTFRERARVLAAEIQRDLPEFTVHDISHLDALWETADLAAGPNYPLNPIEAFVLGGSFLIHDLGMGIAAYPEGIEALRGDKTWEDAIAAACQSELGRSPTSKELENPTANVEKLAVAEMLRSLHAQRAEQLALISWQAENGETYRLLENSELRGELARIMGRIAHSHWWPVERLKEEFSTSLGAPYGYPREWTVDPLKLACLLRIADVSHIDARRAPGFLRAIRRPRGTAKEHWIFQEYLHQPRLREDRLLYTSGHRFNIDEAPAWWLCFDTLQMVDRELRQTDALLADTSRPRLAARSVVGVEEPERLISYVPTEGWAPVDARLKVGDVAQLVKRLGGEELYGRDQTVPLRELIQNACDAVRARRILETLPDTWGSLTVELGQDSDGYWLEVEDNGIGMSASVLTGALLDFGDSYWGSDSMRSELPGLLSSPFEPTGKYGIGFFSVFMLGQHVRVTSRRPEVARKDTLVLEFQTGLLSRPILREANDEEILRDGGTRVRVWLNESPYESQGLLGKRGYEDLWTLSDVCTWLAPALDVDLYVREGDRNRELVLTARDWITLKPKELLSRIRSPHFPGKHEADLEEIGNRGAERNLRLLEEHDGTVVGRASVSVYEYEESGKRSKSRLMRFSGRDGVVVVGGLRASRIQNISGIFIGLPERAARDHAIPVVSSDILEKWATKQASLVHGVTNDCETQAEIAETILVLKGNTGKLAVAQTASGWVSQDYIATQEQPDEIVLVQDATVNLIQHYGRTKEFALLPNVFAVAKGTPVILDSMSSRYLPHWPPNVSINSNKPGPRAGTLAGLVIEALARAWDCSIEDVIDASEFSNDEIQIDREIAVADGEIVTSDHVDVIRNPASATIT